MCSLIAQAKDVTVHAKDVTVHAKDVTGHAKDVTGLQFWSKTKILNDFNEKIKTYKKNTCKKVFASV